jgi:hypothetical protein
MSKMGLALEHCKGNINVTEYIKSLYWSNHSKTSKSREIFYNKRQEIHMKLTSEENELATECRRILGE